MLFKFSVSFDLSFAELFWPLINGGALVITKQREQVNPDCIFLVFILVWLLLRFISFIPARHDGHHYK